MRRTERPELRRRHSLASGDSWWGWPVLNTRQTISHLTNTKDRAGSERRLFLPSKKPLKGKRRRRKFPLKVKKRPSVKQKPRAQFGPLKAREPGGPAEAGADVV